MSFETGSERKNGRIMSKRGERDSNKPNIVRRFLAWDGCLMVSSLVGVGLGFVVGFTFYYCKVSPRVIVWTGLPGELYMRMLKAAVLPLVVTSIIAGTAGLKPKENGRLTGAALGYIITTNVIGAIVGTVLAVLIHPGAMATDVVVSSATVDTHNLQTEDLFADLVRNMVPDNLVSATFQKSQTRYRPVALSLNDTGGNGTAGLERYVGTGSGTNYLGLVIACAAIGMATAQLGDAGKPFHAFFASAAEIIFLLVQWLIMFTPIGAASLIITAIGTSSDIGNTFRGLGLFVLAETAGNAVIGLLVLPAIYFVFLRQNPLSFLKNAFRPALTGVLANTSTLALPEIMRCAETRYGVDSRASRFVGSLVVTTNRDGSMMFISLTALYMAQIHASTSAETVVLITVLAAVGSLAIPGVPSGSLVTVLMILASLDIPPANIGIILALEWFSDRSRTFVNGFSHVLCCVVTWHLCQDHLQPARPHGVQVMENGPKDKCPEDETPMIVAVEREGGAEL